MSASPARLYRVLNGKAAGQLVTEDDTVVCDEEYGGCNGYGQHFRRWHRSMGFGPAEQSYGTTCPVCGGVGRVLGWPEESWMEVQRLAEVTSEELARRGTQADETTRTRADLPRQASSGSVDRAVRAAVHRR